MTHCYFCCTFWFGLIGFAFLYWYMKKDVFMKASYQEERGRQKDVYAIRDDKRILNTSILVIGFGIWYRVSFCGEVYPKSRLKDKLTV